MNDVREQAEWGGESKPNAVLTDFNLLHLTGVY